MTQKNFEKLSTDLFWGNHDSRRIIQKNCLDNFSKRKGVLEDIISNSFSTAFYFHNTFTENS